MGMKNPFSQFKASDVSDAINIVPNSYGLLNERNVFPVKGVATSTVSIESHAGQLNLLPTSQSSTGPGTVGKVGKRKMVTLSIPRIEHDEHIDPKEVQDVTAMGGNELKTMATLLNDKLATARAKHDITLEWHRIGALKGSIKDADGSELLGLFDAFDVTQSAVDFTLGTGTTDIEGKIIEVVETVTKALQGEMATGIQIITDTTFMKRLFDHAKFDKLVNRERINAGATRDGLLTFRYGNVTFTGYWGEATGFDDVNGDPTTLKFFDANDGIAYPSGTANTFRTYVGPADFNESVNQLGRQYYAKVEPSKFGRGYDLHTQQNILPLCLRPGVLVRVHSSN